MNEDSARDEDKSNDDAIPVPPAPVAPGDRWLMGLVQLFDANPQASMSITLCVEGLIISGDLISAKDYHEKVKADMAEDLKRLASQLGVASEAKEKVKMEESSTVSRAFDRPSKTLSVEYIHLGNASIYQPGQAPVPERGVLFRVRIASVSAFTLSKLTAETR